MGSTTVRDALPPPGPPLQQPRRALDDDFPHRARVLELKGGTSLEVARIRSRSITISERLLSADTAFGYDPTRSALRLRNVGRRVRTADDVGHESSAAGGWTGRIKRRGGGCVAADSRIPTSIEEHIAGFSPSIQAILKQLRATIRRAAPAAQEVIR